MEGTLFEAIRSNSIDLVKDYITKGLSFDVKGYHGMNALHYAIIYGNIDIIKIFLEAGINPSHLDEFGRPPYLLTLDVTILKLFLHLDINVKDNRGLSLLHRAAMHNEVETIKLLLQNGGDKESIDILGNRPLHLAVEANEYHSGYECAKILIESGSSVNVCNNKGDTPLHLSAVREYQLMSINTGLTRKYVNCFDRDVIALLINGGIDTKIKNKEGLTALELAKKHNNIAWINFYNSSMDKLL